MTETQPTNPNPDPIHQTLLGALRFIASDYRCFDLDIASGVAKQAIKAWDECSKSLQNFGSTPVSSEEPASLKTPDPFQVPGAVVGDLEAARRSVYSPSQFGPVKGADLIEKLKARTDAEKWDQTSKALTAQEAKAQEAEKKLDVLTKKIIVGEVQHPVARKFEKDVTLEGPVPKSIITHNLGTRSVIVQTWCKTVLGGFEQAHAEAVVNDENNVTVGYMHGHSIVSPKDLHVVIVG